MNNKLEAVAQLQRHFYLDLQVSNASSSSIITTTLCGFRLSQTSHSKLSHPLLIPSSLLLSAPLGHHTPLSLNVVKVVFERSILEGFKSLWGRVAQLYPQALGAQVPREYHFPCLQMWAAAERSTVQAQNINLGAGNTRTGY
jgi:hypothetical protein